MREQWRPVHGFEGRYSVSNTGRVRSLLGLSRRTTSKSEFLSPHMDSRGYLKVKLSKHGVGRNYSVHALVAEAFLGARKPKLTVNHKDANKLNNTPSNLEWLTASENTKHAWKLGLIPRTSGSAHIRARAVCQYALDGSLLNTYDCIADAWRATGVWKMAIRNVCAWWSYKEQGTYYGSRKACQTAKGYIWKYKGEK